MNPVYELLDFPVAMGRADDVFVRDRNCFGESVELTFAEVLDRSAKFAGVLRLMEVGEGMCVSVASDVSPLTAHLVKLGAWRVGACVASVDSGASVRIVAGETPDQSPRERGAHQAFSKPVKALPSHFEGAVALFEGNEFVLDTVVRDARVEPASVVELRPDAVVQCPGSDADGDENGNAPASSDAPHTERLTALEAIKAYA